MQTTLMMQAEAIPVVRASPTMKHKALEYALHHYRQRLDAFKRTHQMSSDQFAKQFYAGNLGDDADWFEWEFVLDAIRETESQ